MPDSQPSAETPQVTVVVPTYNGGARVERLLAGLANQCASCPGAEVLVIDNRSTDPLVGRLADGAAAATLGARGWTVRVLPESRAGVTFARARGLQEARTEVVCFLDDDVEPGEGFLARGAGLFGDPGLGAVMPRIRPRFAATPPPSVLKRQHLLAVNEHFLPDRPVTWAAESFPFAPVVTAGLFVRRRALEEVIARRGLERLLPGRIGPWLGGGEDTELGILLQKGGYSVRYDPTLELVHHISAHRLQTTYFVRLIAGIVRSEATLRRIYRPDLRGPSLAGRLAQVFVAAGAAPLLCVRPDGRREAAFVLASRLAQLAGPYRVLLDRDRTEPRVS